MTSLCAIALDAIAHALRDGVRRVPRVDALDLEWRAPRASFVTLERDGRLLGCIGSLDALRPLGIDVAEHALAAAFDDPRLPPVTRDDFPTMSVKVSVVSPSEPLDASSLAELAAAVRPGIDGCTVSLRGRHATFLPAVWEKLPDPAAFLRELWRKAGFPPDTWQPGIRVSRYTTVETCDPGPRPPL